MSNPILFKNAFINLGGNEARLMYFYKDAFFIEPKGGGIGVIDTGNFNKEQIDEILTDKEQQKELPGDNELITLLDNVLATIKNQEGDPPYDA